MPRGQFGMGTDHLCWTLFHDGPDAVIFADSGGPHAAVSARFTLNRLDQERLCCVRPAFRLSAILRETAHGLLRARMAA